MKVYISGKITGDVNYKNKFWMVLLQCMMQVTRHSIRRIFRRV